jgi:threonine dehydratase
MTAMTTPIDQEPLVALADVRAAAERLRGRVVRTPLLPFATADPDRPLWLKPESLQPTGAFKLRGAYNAILQRLDEARDHGLVTHSSGNHARAVAWVARDLGLRATIVMPDAAPENKVKRVRALGAEVVIVPPDELIEHTEQLSATHGFLMVPPFDDAAVVAGQGTTGLEVVEDLPDVGAVLVPVGGGGLIAGVATAVKTLSPSTLVVGVEPELAGDVAESFRRGQRVEWTAADTYRTMADGLRSTCVGAVPWRQISRYVDDIVTVAEDEIHDALRILAGDARLIAEPSGAVTTAAYLHHAGQLPTTGRFVAIVSGGNVAPEVFARLVLESPRTGG